MFIVRNRNVYILANISYPTQSYRYFYAHSYSKFAKNCTFRRAITEKPYNIKVSNSTLTHNFILRISVPSFVEIWGGACNICVDFTWNYPYARCSITWSALRVCTWVLFNSWLFMSFLNHIKNFLNILALTIQVVMHNFWAYLWPKSNQKAEA